MPGNLFERLIRYILVKHMEENSFSNAQREFVTGRSCSTQLLELMEELTETLDSNGDVNIIYSFDKVPHKRLLKQPLRV